MPLAHLLHVTRAGVVAVAVMGLYGAATNRWDMSTEAEEEGTFDGFWETAAFIVNAIVFMFTGIALVNFFIRCPSPHAALFAHGCTCAEHVQTV